MMAKESIELDGGGVLAWDSSDPNAFLYEVVVSEMKKRKELEEQYRAQIEVSMMMMAAIFKDNLECNDK